MIYPESLKNIEMEFCLKAVRIIDESFRKKILKINDVNVLCKDLDDNWGVIYKGHLKSLLINEGISKFNHYILVDDYLRITSNLYKCFYEI